MVGRQEIWRPIVGRVVHKASSARCKSTVDNERHTSGLGGPCCPFGTIHVDVAGAAVAKGSAVMVVGAMGPTTQGAVALDHLVNVQQWVSSEVQRLMVLHHKGVGLDHTCGQSAPLFFTAVVQCAQHFAVVRGVEEQLASFGHLEVLEAQGHAGGIGTIDQQTPYELTVFRRPTAMGLGRPRHLMLHPKAPWGFFVQVRDGIFPLELVAVQRGELLRGRQGGGPQGLPAKRDLGLNGAAHLGQEAQCQGDVKRSTHGIHVKGSCR